MKREVTREEEYQQAQRGRLRIEYSEAALTYWCAGIRGHRSLFSVYLLLQVRGRSWVAYFVRFSRREIFCLRLEYIGRKNA